MLFLTLNFHPFISFTNSESHRIHNTFQHTHTDSFSLPSSAQSPIKNPTYPRMLLYLFKAYMHPTFHPFAPSAPQSPILTSVPSALPLPSKAPSATQSTHSLSFYLFKTYVPSTHLTPSTSSKPHHHNLHHFCTPFSIQKPLQQPNLLPNAPSTYSTPICILISIHLPSSAHSNPISLTSVPSALLSASISGRPQGIREVA